MRVQTTIAAAAALLLTALTPAAGSPVEGETRWDPPQPAEVGSHTVTLVTGDRVTVYPSADGRESLAVDPAPREGRQPGFDAVTEDGDVYVFPTDAGQLVPEVLDRELFNVTKLAAAGYTDGVPVIVAYQPDRADPGPAPLAAPADLEVAGLDVTASLPSIDAVAATIAPGGAWWSATGSDSATPATPTPAPAAPRALAAGPLAGVAKVWLDGPVQPVLAESVPQIGAPAAWDAGYDGAGRTVAVLDTGIDPDHPDLAGRVAAQENFTNSDSAVDRHGHGTHVAGIVAGSGSASDGTYRGVAPGAELLNGKVLNDFGFGQDSWIIAGMEWAAESGADVVNMSLGSAPTDGTDPVSMALNRISGQHDVLFVVAAGNTGPGAETVVAPGTADAALTVGNVTKNEELAIDSSRGPRVGDAAVKPEITGPGTDIVSARASGTSLGFPLDDNYTRLSGTSMAAPHVAGAAALLLQQRPGLGAQDLKAALVSTATPNPALDVFEQGAGRVDVARLIDTPVQAAPATLNFGVFRFPHEGAAPAQATVSYTNLTGEPATLALSVEATSRDGDVPPPAMLSVDPPQLALAPGESAEVTVTVDVRHGEIGRYGGNLLATAGETVLTRTPLSFYKEEELHELTLQGIARNGQPAIFNSSLDIVNVDGSHDFAEHVLRFDNNGEISLRLPPGMYSATAWIDTYVSTELQEHETTVVSEPEFVLDGDTTVVLDARPAVEVTVATPAHPDAAPHRFTFGHLRRGAGGSEISRLGLRAEWPRVYAVPTPPATIGEHEFFTHWRLGEPKLVLDVPGLDLTYPPLFFADSPVVEFDLERLVVDAGSGTAAEFAAVDAEDAIVLVRRGGPSFFQLGANAAAAGAAALLVANDRPGQIANFGIGPDADMPAIRLSQEDGDELQARLAAGAVTATLTGKRNTDYLYELVYPEREGLPSDLAYRADVDALATVENAFHSDVDRLEVGEYREMFRPWQASSVVFLNDLVAPEHRTEYLTPGDTRHRQRVQMPAGSMQEYLTSYQSGELREQSWWRQVTGPGVRRGSSQESARPARRVDDTLVLELAEWTDADGHWGDRSFVDSTAFRLFADDELVVETARPRGQFSMLPEPATYRLELDVARDAEWWTTSTATSTAWTVHSARPTSGTEVLPLLLVDYQADVDLRNAAPHPRDRRGPATVGLHVHHQPGATGPAVAGARAWASYDDGQTWQPRPTRPVGDGRYEVILPSPDPADTSGFVSIRVEAWDAGGNRIEQEISRAWRLPPR